MPGWLHIIVAMVAGAVVGALWGGIAGFLKATTGANEVISTIMLNYTALYMGLYFFGTKGPLHSSDPANASIPVSNDVFANTRLPGLLGRPGAAGPAHRHLHRARASRRSSGCCSTAPSTGYEVRAVGFNPDAAEYGGISAGRNYVKVMLICGAFAGLAGAIDVLGWQFRIATIDVQVANLGFYGIAVALLGRNTAVGTAIAALLFAALLNGTSVRNLDPTVFAPELGEQPRHGSSRA